MSDLFNVIAVNIKTTATRVIAIQKTHQNAEAIVKMAVMRRGVDEEFFEIVPAIEGEERIRK